MPPSPTCCAAAANGSPPPTSVCRPVSDAVHLLDRLFDTPAPVMDSLGTVLVQNRMSTLVSGDWTARAGRDRNSLWHWFTDPRSRDRVPEQDRPERSRSHVADLRAAAARSGGNADAETLVTDLLAASPEFAALWAAHEVAVRRSDAKCVVHPEVGLLDLLCERLTSDVDGSTLIVLYPRPGTDCRDKLDLLSVIGTQQLRPGH